MKKGTKNGILKTTSLFLALILSISLFGCSSSPESYEVLSLDGTVITNNHYKYDLSVMKSSFLYSYLTSYGSSVSEITDIPELWSVEISSGYTVGDSLLESVYLSQLIKLYYLNYAEKNNISLAKSDLDSIQSSFDKIKNSFKSNGDFLDYLEGYELDDEMLLQYLKNEKLAAMVKTKLFTAGGELYIPDTLLIDIFKETYVTIKHVYINNVNKTLYNGKTVPLTEAEKAEKQTLIDSIVARLNSGEKIDDLISEKSEDTFYKERPNGFTFRKGDTGMTEFEDAVFKGEEGVAFSVNTNSGAYIVVRLPLYELALSDVITTLRNELISEKEEKIIKSVRESVIRNDEFFSVLSAADIPVIAS